MNTGGYNNAVFEIRKTVHAHIGVELGRVERTGIGQGFGWTGEEDGHELDTVCFL